MQSRKSMFYKNIFLKGAYKNKISSNSKDESGFSSGRVIVEHYFFEELGFYSQPRCIISWTRDFRIDIYLLPV